MIGYFKRKIVSWVKEDWEQSNKVMNRIAIAERDTISIDHDGMMEDPIRFELQSVIGGHLLRVRQPYDRKTDKTPSSTYIINSGDDIGARVTKIINIELLK